MASQVRLVSGFTRIELRQTILLVAAAVDSNAA